MRKLGIIILVLLGMYGCWQVKYPSGAFRYKLTLVVDDNGKQIVASSVCEVHIQVEPRITPETVNYVTVKGEAVAVDIGEKGILFALLRSNKDVDYGYRIVFDAFPIEGASTAKGIEYYTHLKAKKELNFDNLPMLVRFRDINDPKTVELVDPNDLEKSFGKGVKLVSATIEITDEPVTKGIENRLTWIREYYDKLFDGNIIMTGDAKNRLANDLGSGFFASNMGLSKNE